MKIIFTQRRELPGRKVKPGDIMEAPRDGSDELLRAYVTNGIAAISGGEPERETEVDDDVR
jgi:hypothetical protein